MTLAPAEALLAALAATPDGTPASELRLRLGAALEPARQTLIDRGHAIVRRGDRIALACAPRHFDPAAFARVRHGRWGAVLEVWEETGSTNDLARDGADRGAPDGAVYLAEHQTAGRGRQGRVWACAPHAGLLFSCIVDVPLEPETVPTLLPLALGLGFCTALRDAAGLDVGLKWPNDLVLDDGKLAGLLVEARRTPRAHLVVGLGLNVEPAAAAGAQSLAARGVRLSREALLAHLLAGAEAEVERWRRGERGSLLDAWRAQDRLLGRAVRVETPAGVFEGVAEAIGPAGELCVRGPDGAVRAFVAGEVHLA